MNVTFIDYLGQRHPVAGRVGMALTDVCAKHDMDLLYCDAAGGGTATTEKMTDDYARDLYGEGPQSTLSHVILPPAWYGKLEDPSEHEKGLLGELDDDVISPT